MKIDSIKKNYKTIWKSHILANKFFSNTLIIITFKFKMNFFTTCCSQYNSLNFSPYSNTFCFNLINLNWALFMNTIKKYKICCAIFTYKSSSSLLFVLIFFVVCNNFYINLHLFISLFLLEVFIWNNLKQNTKNEENKFFFLFIWQKRKVKLRWIELETW